jgi:glycosyltransferase involved in cell wall biosynthesis
MRILMAMNSLAMGGAEKFFTNLVTALHERHEVTCYIPALRCSDPAMLARLPERLSVESIACFTPFTYRVFYKLTLMIQKRFPAFDPEMALHTQRLRTLHRRHRFDIVNAQLMPAARQVCAAFEQTRLPITKSDHGDTRHPDPVADAVIFRRLDALVCPAEANARVAHTLGFHPRCRITTIPYGYRGSAGGDTALEPFDGVTFGMVARGVADKGWRELITAARRLHAEAGKPIRLVLIGDGPCLQELRREINEPWIIFAGQQNEPERWVRGFDVGLLPTCLPEESLPNSIIEYLACGKPVIATDIGGIPDMIWRAGRLVPLAADGRADVNHLAAEMLALTHSEARFELALGAADAFARFSMEHCLGQYENLFASLCETSMSGGTRTSC